MRLEVFSEKKEEERVVRLALVSADGRVDLVVVDAAGNPVPRGKLLTLHINDGRLWMSMARGIDPDLGFSLDSRGALLLR